MKSIKRKEKWLVIDRNLKPAKYKNLTFITFEDNTEVVFDKNINFLSNLYLSNVELIKKKGVNNE